MSRHYFRCKDCLGVLVVSCEREGDIIASWSCSCGSKRGEHMGRVHIRRLVVEHTGPACDYRCTQAPGPNCDCRCGGENHGTHREVTYTRGEPIPSLAAPNPVVGEEWRSAEARAIAHVDVVAPGLREGRWVPRHQWDAAATVKYLLNKARKARSHKGRMALIEKALAVGGDAR